MKQISLKIEREIWDLFGIQSNLNNLVVHLAQFGWVSGKQNTIIFHNIIVFMGDILHFIWK